MEDIVQKLRSTGIGNRELYLGNEAIVRGAIEGGVQCVTAYPGTPSSEIPNLFSRISEDADVYFEFSINEKVALEVAIGSALSGQRTLCTMKHVGVNVAADALMTNAYTGTVGGLVLLTADEPGCHSSQNEQDNRYYAQLAKIPMLEPSSPQEAAEMMSVAFTISEQFELPVLFLTTTRINHMRGIVEHGKTRKPDKKIEFVKDPFRYVCVPAVARIRHKVLTEQIEKIRRLAGQIRFNYVEGNGSIGIVTSGVSYNYVRDVINSMNLNDEASVLKLGLSHPFPDDLALKFMKKCKKVIVVEELEPYLENNLTRIAYHNKIDIPVYGKHTGHFSARGEFGPSVVENALSAILERPYRKSLINNVPSLPTRPPNLCNGCPHRATFYAVKLVTRDKGIYPMDIGCYTLGMLPPLQLADFMVCMGSSVGGSGGFAQNTDRPVVAFIGDSTFFHSGLSGLINAVHNRHNFTLVIMDNRTTAMTGHQPHPASSGKVDGKDMIPVNIEGVVKSIGVKSVRTVNPLNIHDITAAVKEAVESDELSVIISRAPCLFVMTPGERKTYQQIRYEVDHSRCSVCSSTIDGKGCSIAPSKEVSLVRAYNHIMRKRSAEPVQYSSGCTYACPVNTCVPGYVSRISEGRYLDALNLIRENNPLPSVCGYVCHHPCESSCSLNSCGEPVSVRNLKRFAAQYDIPFHENKYFLKKINAVKRKDAGIAVVGSGPSGLSCAYQLFMKGYDVVVYEKDEVPGGMLNSAIPRYRLPKDILERDIKFLMDMGITFKTSTCLGRDITIEQLKQNFDAVYLALGMPEGKDMGFKASKTAGFYTAIEYLKKANAGEAPDTGRKVVVIGGGDAAVDAARTARRVGRPEVLVLYRRTRQEMPARDEEIEDAIAEGISFQFLASPLKLQIENDRIQGIEMQKMENGTPDASRKKQLLPVEGETFTVSADTVITAVGQKPEIQLDGIEYQNDCIVVSPGGVTSMKGVFAGGDCVTGPWTVVDALQAGRDTAYAIDQYISSGKVVQIPTRFIPPSENTIPGIDPDMAGSRVARAKLDADIRIEGFVPVEQFFNEKEAIEESQRCFTCGSCALCRNCLDNFGCGAITLQNGEIVIDEEFCTGCGVCSQICPNGAIVPVERS